MDNDRAIHLSLGFYGAARTTTGSRHILKVNEDLLLLDCGLYQGRRQDTWDRNKNFGFAPRSVKTVLLSHAHIDHSGNLPNLVKQGFNGSIYCTPATADLARVMLRDSASIQEKDAEFLNRPQRRGRRPNGKEIEPLYSMEDAERCIEHLRGVFYHKTFHVLRDVEAEFLEAGHILGSAAIILSIHRNGQTARLGYSGDIGRVGLPLLRDPEIPRDLDWLMMEGTYGARTHDPISEAKEELRQTVQRIAARGGKIIVPSFSVERTQEIIYYLNELSNEGRLPPIAVYVDSPLAVRVTEIFRLHPECFNDEASRVLNYDSDPFGFNRLTYIHSVEESKKLNDLRMPCMIISASGMCEGGRILHHLRNNIEDSKNCIMFVGYQAEGTLGRKIVERQPVVNIYGEPHQLRAEVVTLNTMSGHADKNDLFDYARKVKETSPRLKKVFLIHGEEPALNELGGRMRSELGLDVDIPQSGEQRTLDVK
ncbi:MAG: MBL fold metallo-hydrolase [Candidatus Sumerlaeota bacterium]|nr:MBL fold metallo-hydrolase [Candidatus Sumerlaeota bacterium]